MKPRLESLAKHLLLLCAFLAPWSVYEQVPGVGLAVSECIKILLLGLFLTHLLLSRTLRVPFEFAWPIAIPAIAAAVAQLAMALALVVSVSDSALLCFLEASQAIPAGLLTFLAVVHFARSRELIAQCLRIWCLSTACVAVLSIGASLGAVVPTAFSMSSGAVLAGPRSLFGGGYGFVWALVAAVYFASFSERTLRRRALFVVCAAFLAAGLVALLVPSLPRMASWSLPRAATQTWLGVIYMGLMYWLMARVAAKLEVNRREGEPGIHALLLVLLGLKAAIYVAAIWRPDAGLELGLIAAYALPDSKEPSRVYGWHRLAVLPSLLLIAFNIGYVHPGNVMDARSYTTLARAFLYSGDMQRVESRMEFFAQRYPAERQTHFWLGHVELARECPYRAACEFAEAVKPPEDARLILPPPTAEERDEFLAKLRDYCSALPEPASCFAYERALIAEGKGRQALNLLELRSATFQVPAAPSSVRQRAHTAAAGLVVELLRAREIENDLRAWDLDRLFGLLDAWGCVVQRAPDTVPRRLLPLACVARHGPHVQEVLVVGALGGAHARRATSERIEGMSQAAGQWSELEPAQSGRWRTTLSWPVGEGETPFATVSIDDDGDIEVDQAGALESAKAPDAPVVRVWLP